MNTDFLSYTLLFKDKLEHMIDIFESYVYSLYILNKIESTIFFENKDDFKNKLINDSKKFVKVGSLINERCLILGAIEINKTLIIFYEEDDTVKIKDFHKDEVYNTYHIE